MTENEKQTEVVDIRDLIPDDHNFNAGTEKGREMIEKSFRELGAGRSILLDKNNRIIAGNKSQQAAIATGITKVRIVDTEGDEIVAVRRRDVDLDSKVGRELAFADNATQQVSLAWDETELQTVQADVEGFDIADFGFDIEDLPQLSESDQAKEDVRKRTQWGKAKDYEEPVCNMVDTIEIHALRGYKYVHSFKTGSTEGTPISELKKPENAYMFALKAKELITATIGLKQTKGWCIITTPKRRHKEKNFASLVCEQLSQMLGIPFHEDVVEAKNRARIDPVFTLVKEVEEPNIIIYDDILTGGTTLYTTANLFPTKNIFLVVGINNHR